ncbi:hypothetical protein HDV03_002985 [Kappamyces sp. JEL0829]|nr:hypothetical protein HDV03_002985 [Kappamyces sp. JEL0829]
MTLLNEAKKRRLNGHCDYTIVHRGHRNLPHLGAIEAKVTNKETLLQCIGESASIHFQRKINNMHNRIVYGIHSTGSIWKVVYINEGVVAVSKEFHLNAEHYVKEEFDLIYRLVIMLFIKQTTSIPVSTTTTISEAARTTIQPAAVTSAVTPTLAPAQETGSSTDSTQTTSQAGLLAIILPISLAIVVVGLVVLFVYHRKKYRKKAALDKFLENQKPVASSGDSVYGDAAPMLPAPNVPILDQAVWNVAIASPSPLPESPVVKPVPALTPGHESPVVQPAPALSPIPESPIVKPASVLSPETPIPSFREIRSSVQRSSVQRDSLYNAASASINPSSSISQIPVRLSYKE